MGTTFRGAFVISWSQTEVDGLEAAPVQSLNVGPHGPGAEIWCGWTGLMKYCALSGRNVTQ